MSLFQRLCFLHWVSFLLPRHLPHLRFKRLAAREFLGHFGSGTLKPMSFWLTTLGSCQWLLLEFEAKCCFNGFLCWLSCLERQALTFCFHLWAFSSLNSKTWRP